MNETPNNPSNPNWERQALETLIRDYIKEKRSKRRWSIFFKSVFFILMAILVYSMMPDETTPDKLQKPHVSLIDVKGGIFDTAETDSDHIVASLREAFDDKKTQGIILRINSPGGSPVQAAYVYNEIRRLRNKYPKIKLYAVCMDICASAAYYIASAADRIYANQSSLVGSIGVMYDGFGFVDTLQKLGVERRLYTSGAHKGMLDPFSPTQPTDRVIIQNIMDGTYQQFINSVKQGRGNRLKDDPDLFSGRVWNGMEAIKLGLIDGFKSAGEVARDEFKNENVLNYTTTPNLIERISKKLGESFAGELANRTGLQPYGFK